MSVSVIKRPLGFILSETENFVDITNTGGFASVFHTSHGLVDGDYVYIKSVVKNYNGFWYVDKNDDNNFWFREYATASNVLPLKNANGAIYQKVVEQHGVQSAYLPIVYKLSNTLWPTNTADTIRTISSVTDSNGYCALSISGDIKATGSAAVLEFVKITNAGGDGSLNGVYPIVAYTNDTTFSIDCIYSATNDTNLTGASIQYYYNNYCIRVRVYSGIKSNHIWSNVKPIELLAELKIIPDSNGIAVFSINELIKVHLNNRNELLLGTLPNNTDFWSQFYITYAESHDDSDGITLSTFTSSYTSDESNFTGMAINSDMPFKNKHIGHMTDYVLNGDTTRFLTLFDQPVIFEDKYFDISFINHVYYQTFINPGLDTFQNDASSGTAWTLGATPSVTLAGAAESKRLYTVITKMSPSVFYYLQLGIISTTAANVTMTYNFLDSSLAVLDTFTQILGLNAGYNFTDYSMAGNANAAYLSIRVLNDGGLSETISLEGYRFYPNSQEDITFAGIEAVVNNESTDVDMTDQGLYRIELNLNNCEDTNQEITLYRKKKNVFPFTSAIVWNDVVGWTTKRLDYFQETITSASSGIVGSSYLSITNVPAGTIIEFTPNILLSASTLTYGSMVASFYAANGFGAAASNVGTISVNSEADLDQKIRLTLTGDATRIYVTLTANSVVGGDVSAYRITLPSFWYEIDSALTETKSLKYSCGCLKPNNEGLYLSWLNYLGGFDYWLFSADQIQEVNVVTADTTDTNIFYEWPNSYGEFADTIKRETYREAVEVRTVRSQHLTSDQVNAIKYLRTSTVVSEVISKYDRRTVLVDRDSFVVLDEGNKLHSISFRITYTDNIPVQS